MSKMKIGCCILNKNEDKSLEILLPNIDKSIFDLVYAVDGGSTDDSVRILNDANIEVLVQKAKGRGQAFKLAFEFAKIRGFDAIVFFSSDGNEDPKDLERFIGYLYAGYDLVIGSRMMPESYNEEDIKLFRFRKWGNKTFAWLAYLTFGLGKKRITDPINGYRAITTYAWERMAVQSEGFSVEYETSIKSYKLGLSVKEFPTFEHPRLFGASSATAFRTTEAMLRTYLRNLRK
jgi:glycosyltransferase involved in cell wall biosynthesis